MNDSDRGTGRTTRLLCEAATAAYGGEQVCFLVARPHDTQRMLELLNKHRLIGRVYPTDQRVAYPSGGNIRFVVAGTGAESGHFGPVLADHTVAEMQAGPESEQVPERTDA